MFDDVSKNNVAQAEKPVDVDENLTRKRLAPLTPAITSVDQRISMLEDKGRRRGKRNSWIGILSSLLILIVVFSLGYFLLSEINRLADKVDVDENMIINSESDPDNLCPKDDSCCLTSLSRLKKNGYMSIDELGVCPEGFMADKLKCETSLSWCAPIEADTPSEVPVEIDRSSIDTDAWKSYKNPEYGFYFNYPDGFYVLFEESGQEMEIKRIYVKQIATSSEYYFNLKVVSGSGSSSIEDYVNEQKRVLASVATSSGVVAELSSQDYKTENLSGKKIVVATKYEGNESISEEVVFTGNGFVFAISYPDLSGDLASSSPAEISRAIITSFNLANLIKTESEETISQPAPVESGDSTADNGAMLDDDGDGLSNEDEIKYHTDPKKADTDSDGFSDGDEVKNGYNPNGQGLL